MLRRIFSAAAVRWRYWKYLTGARASSYRALASCSGRNILVLCYGNIYRSPFAAKRLSDCLPGETWGIRSAGFHDKSGRRCADDFVTLAAQFGVDLTEHRSSRVSRDDVEWADLVVIMDGRNRLSLEQFGNAADGKIVWIAAWLPGFRADVEDPYGQSPAAVNQVTGRLFDAVETLRHQLTRVEPDDNRACDSRE